MREGGRLGERETKREREGGREGGRERMRERTREGGRRERERQHLTMMTIQYEHFNCMKTVSCMRERERGLCPYVKCCKW